MKVKDLMRKNYVSITPDTSVKRVNQILHQYNLRKLLVLEVSGELVGIVTYSDLFRHLLPNYSLLLSHETIMKTPEKYQHGTFEIFNIPVKDIMTKEPETVHSELLIIEAGALMLAYKVKQMPVVDNGKLVGVISHSDILWGLLIKENNFFS